MDIKEALRKYRMKYWHKEADETSWTPLWQGGYCRWGKREFKDSYGVAYILWARVKWYISGIYRPIKKTGSVVKGLRRRYMLKRKVKAASKAIWKRVAVEQARQDEETRLMKEHAKEFVDAWLKENEFGLTLAMLSTNCMSSVARKSARDIEKNVTAC